MRRAVSLCLAAAVLAGCTGSPVHRAPSRVPTSPAAAPPTPVVLPAITLRADFSEPPARWERVAAVPFGSRPQDLKILPSKEHPTFEPMDFAVEPDGSLMIADPLNNRAAHYTAGGRYIDQIDGYGLDSREMGFLGDRFVITKSSQLGIFDVYGAAGQPTEYHLGDDEQLVFVTQFVFVGEDLYAMLTTLGPGNGPIGTFRLDLGQGGKPTLRAVPGLPLGPDRWVDPRLEGTEVRLTFLGPDVAATRPIRFSFVSSTRGRTITLRQPVMAIENFVVDGPDLYIYLKMSGTRDPGGGDLVGARYLLRVGDGPLLFERLPQPAPGVDDTQRRHLTLGPDGRLYLMLITPKEVVISRRPT